MTFLLVVAFFLAVTVVPIMIGARVVGAEKTGFGSAVIALILLSVLSVAIEHMVSNNLLAFLVSVAGGAAILSGVLGTTFLKGLAVSFIVVAVQFVVLLMFAGALMGAAS